MVKFDLLNKHDTVPYGLFRGCTYLHALAHSVSFAENLYMHSHENMDLELFSLVFLRLQFRNYFTYKTLLDL